MTKPILSIGIIFRDDIRSIERCLKALEPLRGAIPCQLVMADTGAKDGSRAVAEKYADILIDFPWINDFSAARNAVMDRCTGHWFISVDTDEYLDPDVSELTDYLTHKKKQFYDFCSVVIRNYDTYEMDHDYSDFAAIRMVRLSSGIRYEGSIHERWKLDAGATLTITPLKRTIFHHDGYVGLNGEAGKAKRERNLALIREKLEEKPEDLMTRLQLIESGSMEEDFVEQLRRSVELVQRGAPASQRIGPPILRYAVMFGQMKDLPETEDWLHWMEENFPSSLYTRLDANYYAVVYYHTKKEFRRCITCGENYLAAQRDYKAGKADQTAQIYSVLKTASPYWEQDLKIILANAYREEKEYARAIALLQSLEHYTGFDAKQISNLLLALKDIHRCSEEDTAPALKAFWQGISKPEPSEARAGARIRTFFETGVQFFQPGARKLDEDWTDVLRPSFTLFAPLEGECELGTAAAIWAEEDPQVLTEKLRGVNWERTPIHILGYALDRGAAFPCLDPPMNLEDMDGLALRLAQEDMTLLPALLEKAAQAEGVQALAWTRALAMAAVKMYRWEAKDADGEPGMELARQFAQAEKAFLPVCYGEQALEEEGLFLLPPMHRFGFYCARAFEALEGGDAGAYLRLLRLGLESCKGMKAMVEFLADRTARMRQLLAPPELTALADQVRVVLARFSPDDPAVEALKQSEAYRKVAYLIEGAAVPVWGGIPQ